MVDISILVVEIIVVVALVERWGSCALRTAATVASVVVGRSRSRSIIELLVPPKWTTAAAAATAAVALLLCWRMQGALTQLRTVRIARRWPWTI